MNRRAQFRLVEVSAGVWSIRPAHLDQKAGRAVDGAFIVQVVDIPAGIKSETITGRLSRLIDLREPPKVLRWSELAE